MRFFRYVVFVLGRGGNADEDERCERAQRGFFLSTLAFGEF